MSFNLTPIADSFDFNGTAGQQVTLLAVDHIGAVMFAKAQYGGNSLVPEGRAMSCRKHRWCRQKLLTQQRQE